MAALHLQCLLDVLLQRTAQRFDPGTVMRDLFAIRPDQVLVEIPARGAACFLRQLAEQRIGVATADRARRQHGESYAVVDITDFGAGSRRS